jgi:hypothetical protein
VDQATAAGDARIQVVDFGRQNAALGTGFDYHPTVTEDPRIAGLLTTAVSTVLGW